MPAAPAARLPVRDRMNFNADGGVEFQSLERDVMLEA
jgi:hypothetical protein